MACGGGIMCPLVCRDGWHGAAVDASAWDRTMGQGRGCVVLRLMAQGLARPVWPDGSPPGGVRLGESSRAASAWCRNMDGSCAPAHSERLCVGPAPTPHPTHTHMQGPRSSSAGWWRTTIRCPRTPMPRTRRLVSARGAGQGQVPTGHRNWQGMAGTGVGQHAEELLSRAPARPGRGAGLVVRATAAWRNTSLAVLDTFGAVAATQ